MKKGNKPLVTTADFRVKVGKSYRLRYPDGGVGKDKVHIDYILDNSVYSALCYKLVVCRVWGRKSQRWRYYVYPYYVLAIYNEWE
jgi:hypothetical protein